MRPAVLAAPCGSLTQLAAPRRERGQRSGQTIESFEILAPMIELSVGVLRSQPTSETQPLREWAVGEIQLRAGFIFSAEQRSALLKEELPFKGGFWSLSGSIGGPATRPSDSARIKALIGKRRDAASSVFVRRDNCRSRRADGPSP
jgi:hypothetical protein